MYFKNDTKIGSQNFDYQIWFCTRLFTKLVGADTLKKIFFPALEVNFLKKLPQLVALQIFQSSNINHGESLIHDILLHNY